jgi:glucosylglycerate synthase
MARENILSTDVLQQIEKIKETDILVGLPVDSHVQTAGHILRAVNAALTQHFPDYRCLVVNSNQGSQDESPVVLNQAGNEEPPLIRPSPSVQPIHKIVTPYRGGGGRGNAIRTLFQIAENLNAKACAVIDPNSKSIKSEWIELLLKPVLMEGFEFVSPFYLRHKYDGTLTNSIIYPMTRTLYGKRIRQPIGGDFGFSGRLASHYLSKEIWHKNLTRYEMDIWMTTIAVAEGFKVCQSFLGPKIQDVKDPAIDLSTMLNQVVGVVFDLMETYRNIWFSVRGSDPTPIYGFRFEVGLEPVNANLDRMVYAYRQGILNLSAIWKGFLPEDILESLSKIANSNVPDFHLPDTLWAKTVFEFAVAHHKNRMDRDHLIKSMTPLYLGRTASFVLETQDSTAADVENKIELLCLEYENQKPYLTERWMS